MAGRYSLRSRPIMGLGQGLALLVDLVDELVGSFGAVLGDVGDIDKVSDSLVRDDQGQAFHLPARRFLPAFFTSAVTPLSNALDAPLSS